MARDAAPNQVVVFGNLTADPVLESMGGTPVVNFHVAEPTGKGTNFHKCVLVGQRAERFCEMYRAGDHLCVTGRLMSQLRPCKCCNNPEHQLMSWDLWVQSAGLSGMYDPVED